MSKLTRNVTRDHLREIMAYYGTVQSVELHSALKPGMRAQDGRTATVEYEATEMCDKAIKHMDAGRSVSTESTVLPIFQLQMVARAQIEMVEYIGFRIRLAISLRGDTEEW